LTPRRRLGHRRGGTPHKSLWIIIVILLPLIGSVLWFAIGREEQDDRVRRLEAKLRAHQGDTASENSDA